MDATEPNEEKWLVSTNNFYYCRFEEAVVIKVLRLVSTNNFYYCRLQQIIVGYNWLVSTNNFYYCRSFVFFVNHVEASKH